MARQFTNKTFAAAHDEMAARKGAERKAFFAAGGSAKMWSRSTTTVQKNGKAEAAKKACRKGGW